MAINWKLLRKYNNEFPKIESRDGKIHELPEIDDEVLTKDADETTALISKNKSDLTINPLTIDSFKIQRIVGKSKSLIVNVVVCACLLCYLYFNK